MDNIAQALLAQAEKSPQAVGVHDRAAWLDAFASLSMVEDPVGSRPHIAGVYDSASGARAGKEQLARFYETFIAPNTIRFDVHRDLVCTGQQHVMRDLDIHIQMSDSVHLKVPMHLLYNLTQENGAWKITRLAAHWELIPMVVQMMGNGLSSLPVSMSLSGRMLKYQGVGGMLAYSKSALNIGKKGKHIATALVEALNAHNFQAAHAFFTPDATAVLAGDTTLSPVADLAKRWSGQLQWTDKVIAAGDTVTATTAWQPEDGAEQPAVALFEFDKKRKLVKQMRLYTQSV